MNVERNERIAAFRKVSGYLIWISMPLLILSGLGGTIGLLLFLFFPSGDIGLNALVVEIANNSDIVDWAFQTKMTLFTRLVLHSWRKHTFYADLYSSSFSKINRLFSCR